MYTEAERATNPFIANSMTPFTRSQNEGMYEMYIRRYREANIKRFYGLNVMEFLALDYDIANKLLKDSEAAAKTASNALDGLPGFSED